jgi:hypothetical protein
MKKISILYLLALSAVFTSSAQDKIKYFELALTDQKPVNSLYTAIKLLDSREDTSNYGLVRVGTLDKEAAVQSNGSLETQLNTILSKATASVCGNNELLFQLRRLKFVEKAEADKEYGYCFFRANIYSGKDQFQIVSTIDTFIVVESGDVTKVILEEANKAIVKFVVGALGKNVQKEPVYTFNEIVKIDSIEKAKIKVYNANEFNNGIYVSFESFKNQTPDFSLFSITFEDGEITEIKAKNSKGKVKKIKSDNVYAIVNNGKPFISAEFGFYPLVKNNNDFYFIGDDKINYIKGQVVKSNSIFSSTEYVFSPMPLTSVFEIKVDHVNGKFMRVKEIK